MVQIADQLVYKFFDMGLKMLQNWIVAQVTKRAVTASTGAAEVAATTATEASKTGIVLSAVAARTTAESVALTTQTVAGMASRVAQVVGLSGVAGAAAFASTAAIPIVGPGLAPAAAAAAIGSVLAMVPLASAKGGQDRVPYDGQITELHKDEMVLPAWIANPLRNSINGLSPRNTSGSILKASSETSTTRSTDFGDSGRGEQRLPPMHFHAPGSMTQSEMERHAGTMVKVIKNAIRNRELSIP
jgi:hypothetical protein